MTDKKYYKWVVPTILVAGLLIGLVFSFQPAQAVNTAPGFVEAISAEVGNAPTATGPVCTTTDITDAIAYWDLDEPSGSILYDDSITTHDGTCAGNTCPSSVPGTTVGGQFFIETDNDVITVASSTEFDLTATSDFSVGAWVKTNQDCSGKKVFIGRYHSTNGSWWIGCYPEAGDTGVGFAAFHMKDSEGELATAVGDTQINDGRWHYIVGVRDGAADQNKIYVDGASQDTVMPGIITGTISTGTGLTIGAYTFPGYYFNGTLDEVAIFNAALTVPDMATCPPYAPDVGDVTFEIDTGIITELPITEGELLDKSSGTGVLSITSYDSPSEKGGTITGTAPGGPFTYTPPALYEGTDFFTFVVLDGNGTDTAPGTAVINVILPQFPEVTQPDPQEDNEGDLITPLQIVATDPNDDVMTYAATDLPTGLSIDPGTGIISGTVAYTAAEGSPTKVYSVTVTVTDDSPEANETSVFFDWTIARVNMAPVLEDPGPQENHEGDVVDLQIVATDANEDTLTYGEGGLPPGLSINTSTGLISGTISGAIVSTYSVSVTVTDGEAPTEQVDFDWVITDENRPPDVTQPADQVNNEEDVISLQIVASDLDLDILTYSALGLPGGLTIDPVTGLISGTIAVGASALSPYTVTIAVSDGKAAPVEVIFTWTVNSQMKKLYLPLVTK